LSQGLVTYIILGSAKRLQKLKVPPSTKTEEYLFSNFSSAKKDEVVIDELVANAKGRLIVLLPPSSIPNLKAKKALSKISMIDISSWGWFKFTKKNSDFIKSLKKLSVSIKSIPHLEQGIYFSKRLYFSVGGIGVINKSPFKEIAKRFYSRIDPQKPLPPLIIRTNNINIF
tara:strand:- start:589 stop:1101 length:513 start_codon:yes stop_codon:yes gene_type:complete